MDSRINGSANQPITPALVTRRIPEAGLRRLEESGVAFEVCCEDRPPTREELLAAVKGRVGLLTTLADRVDEELLDSAGTQLKVVANFAVGFNNVDVAEATRRGVAITNTPGVLTEATADIAWLLIMMAARRATEGHRMVVSGGFHGWGPKMLLGQDLVGKTLGIVGAGRIGSAVARRSRGWSMKVTYADPEPNAQFEREFGARRVDLETLCRESDIITVHVPLTPETRGMFGVAQFALMKPTAVFVNTARGEVHDEAALAAALRDGCVFGAGLDVYENEPQVNTDLMNLDRVALLPHIGSGTIQTRDQMAIMAADNLVAALRGERPPNLVNREVFPGA